MSCLIKIENVSKQFGSAVILENITAEINEGDVIAVIGGSGVGKSTLLRALNMLEPPTSGRIFFEGVELTSKRTNLDSVRKKMGMVFQNFGLFSHLTVLENIMLAPVKLDKVSREQAKSDAFALLNKVGLADHANYYPAQLSGGQKQRAAIARTLAMEPKVLLFDEPTSALDPTMVGEVMNVIKALSQEHYTMLIVTHALKFARSVSNRVFFLDEKTIYEDGTPEVIFGSSAREKTRRFVGE